MREFSCFFQNHRTHFFAMTVPQAEGLATKFSPAKGKQSLPQGWVNKYKHNLAL